MFIYTDKSEDFTELSEDSPVSQFLIDQKRYRSPAYLLVQILTGVHNEMLSSSDSNRFVSSL